MVLVYVPMCTIFGLSIKTMKANYRIVNENRTILNAGTDSSSWFTLEDARKLVNYELGQMIYEHDGVYLLWEAF